MAQLEDLLKQNQEWTEKMNGSNPGLFDQLSKGQSPQFLWIGCSDSRVPATQVCDSKPGELFVHRNIANVIVHTDLSSMSVMQYAIQYLKVTDVIVCGHYSCGGVAGALDDKPLGLIDSWLRHIKDVYAANKTEIDQINDQGGKVNRLVELNVAQQVRNVCNTTIVQDAWKRGQELRVHGLVYDLASGRLNNLDLTASGPEQVSEPYKYN